MPQLQDLSGRQYGRWTVVERGPDTPATEVTRGEPRWLCRCSCGTERLVRGRSLRRGESQSCGCLRDEKARGPHGAMTEDERRARHKLQVQRSNAARRAAVAELIAEKSERYAELYEKFAREEGVTPRAR